MRVYWAYALVVIIWSTTPLAIQWSNDSVSFIAAVALRMGLAAAVSVVLMALLRRSLFARPQAWKVYLAASLGIFPTMPVVYWSAQFIPSGLIAVIFALSPFITGALSWLILRENPFNGRRVLALMVALCGLIVIFRDQLLVDARAGLGIAGTLVACGLFSLCSVSLKWLGGGTKALEQTAGALLFSMPGLLCVWWWHGESMPIEFSGKSLAGILYLALMGSLLGFTLFYYVLQRLSASAVSLVTLMTPVLALFVGAVVEGEQVSGPLLLGAAMVLIALLVYLEPGLKRRKEASSGGLLFNRR